MSSKYTMCTSRKMYTDDMGNKKRLTIASCVLKKRHTEDHTDGEMEWENADSSTGPR